MRVFTLIGSIFLFLLIITAVEGDRRKNDIVLEEKSNTKIRAKHNVKDDGDSDEEKPVRRTKNRNKNNDDDDSSDELVPYKKGKTIENKNEDEKPKKFVGRIERGKVKILRTPDKNTNSDEDDSAEDDSTKTCYKKGKNKCNGVIDEDKDEESSEEAKANHKKMKYSIKFHHEKQKTKERKPDMSILRLHKNGKKYGRDEDDSSEEEDEPLKRFHYVDDDD